MLFQVFFTSISIILLMTNTSGNTTAVFYSLLTIVFFNLFTTLRFGATLFVFMKRRIPTEELFSVVFAFALYYIGFIIIDLYTGNPSILLIIIGILLFLFGSLINFISELQRNKWKNNPKNNERIFTTGFFALSRHPNYFGDFLWVLGYALVSGSLWSLVIPVLLALFFQFYNIPLQEKHMVEKYKDQYKEYKKRVKGFFPFLF